MIFIKKILAPLFYMAKAAISQPSSNYGNIVFPASQMLHTIRKYYLNSLSLCAPVLYHPEP